MAIGNKKQACSDSYITKLLMWNMILLHSENRLNSLL